MRDVSVIDQWQNMVEIRVLEEALCPYIANREIRTPCHLYIGQEAIAVGVCAMKRPGDLIWGNHRSHGHYLASGGSLEGLVSEIFCRADGCCGGRGGSMHLLAKEQGILGTVPIVAGTVPLAVGGALAHKRKDSHCISIAFMGDGATEEGHVSESMNFAALYGLPVLFVIENNLYSSHMHMTERRIQPDLAEFARAHGIDSHRMDGNDVEGIRRTVAPLIEKMRQQRRPVMLELMTFRWRGHVGHRWDEDVGVKRKDELTEWIQNDPIERERNRLVQADLVSAEELTSREASVRQRVDIAVDGARKAVFPDGSSLLDHVYAKGGR